MRRVFLIPLMVVLLSAVIFAGCAAPAPTRSPASAPAPVLAPAPVIGLETVDKVKSDLAAAQAQIKSLQNYAEATKSQLETVRGLYNEARRFALIVAQQDSSSPSDEYRMAKKITRSAAGAAAGPCPLCSGKCGMDDCDCFVYEPLPPM